MKKRSKKLIVLLSFSPLLTFAQSVSIDVATDVHAISPYIYGSNEAYDLSTVTRWGGNRSSAYNWENNASNGGNDYEFISDNFYDYSDSKTPGLPIITATQTADQKNQYNIVSLQAAGYVAADKSGTVSEDEIAPSDRWKPISFHKSAPYTLTPDTEDDTVYIDELINYLSSKLGRAGDGGVSAFAIDNEPYLWSQTHARMHPEQTTYKELIQKTRDLSSVIRNLAPGADIIGPMFFGYTDAYHWGDLNYTSSWAEIYNKSRDYPVKYSWFVDFYLDTLRQVEEETGIKPIDAIAFHWYPESYGATTKKRIVDLDKVCSASELIATDMIEARLQAPRALWDSKYTYLGADGRNSYVCTYNGKAIISKIKKSIDNFYPGTKIAFTEFEYDAENHWSGGLCLVDVLGIFGREDVYLACKWDNYQKYSIAAYNLYLNYDGNGSKFGSTSVYAMQSDTVSLSSFASLDDNKNLHVIVVNKTADVQSTTFNISNGVYTNGVVYGFGQNSSDISQLGTIDEIKNSAFTYAIPAYSAVHIILNAAPQTEMVKAQIEEPNADEIKISFADNLSIISAEEVVNEFTVKINNTVSPISSVSVAGKIATIKLDTEINTTDKDIFVSYKGTNLIGNLDLPVTCFDSVFVYNNLTLAPIYALSADIDIIGRYIKISFSKELGVITNNSGLSIIQNGITIGIDSVKKSDEYDLYIYPKNRIVKYHSTILSAKNNTDIISTDNAALADFSMDLTGGANYAPEIDSSIIIDNYNISLYFNTNMNTETNYDSVGFVIKNSNNEELNYSASYSQSSRILTFTTIEPLLYDETYTLSYEGNDLVVTKHNGVLESFSKILDSNLENRNASVVSIPGTVQGDEYWYRIGDPVVETSSDTSSLSNGYALGYISTNDVYTYKISATESRNYTVYIRYSSESEGELEYIIDGESYHLTLPSSKGFTNWATAFRVIPFTAGEHEINIKILKSGFNINYLNFKDEEVYPNASIKQARILGTGIGLYLTFSTNIETLPLPSDIKITYNDTAIDVTSVEFNSASIIKCNVDTIFYKDQSISLDFSSETILTADGGGVLDTTIIVSNKSTQIYTPPTAIKTLENEAFIAPVPATTNNPITIYVNSNEICTYTISDTKGSVVANGEFTKSTNVTIKQQGTYFITLSNEIESITKKIIVQ